MPICLHLLFLLYADKSEVMDSITLKFSREDADEDYPGALTNVTAKVSLRGQEVGQIEGVQVNRQRIGENSFHVTFDGYRCVLWKLETQ